MNTTVDNAVKQAVAGSNTEAASKVANQFTGATPQDRKQIAAAAAAKGANQILSGVPAPEKAIKFNEEQANEGRKLILDTVRQSASITKRIFAIMRECEDEEEVKGTFYFAEMRAIKTLRDAQEAEQKEAVEAGKVWNEKPIKTLADIGKMNGNAGVASYQVTKKRLIGWMDDAERMCRVMQDWFNYQAKYDGEPQAVVQPDFLNLWSSRYAGSLGWKQFTSDCRLADNSEILLESRKAKDEAAKGRAAAQPVRQHVEETMAQMRSGGRDDSQKLADSTLKCWQAFHGQFFEVANELPIDAINGFLSDCLKNLRNLVAEHRRSKADTTTDEGQTEASSDAALPISATADVMEDTAAPKDEPGDAAGSSQETTLQKPEWVEQADWDGCLTNEEKMALIDSGEETYREEKELMKQADEIADAGSNEPVAKID